MGEIFVRGARNQREKTLGFLFWEFWGADVLIVFGNKGKGNGKALFFFSFFGWESFQEEGKLGFFFFSFLFLFLFL